MLGICFLLLSSQFTLSFGQRILFPNLEGPQLAAALIENYKPEFVLDYKEAREVIYTELYNEDGRVYCVYSEYSLPCAPDEENPILKLQKLGFVKSMITEHSYPRSKGAKYGNAKSDMHHLFPARLGVNVARRNYPFAEIDDDQTEKWYYKDKSLRKIPEEDKDLYCESADELFEPPEAFKGNIARAVFYFYTMYEDEALTEDPDFFEFQRETLLKWHQQDPVDDAELRRTRQIAPYQSDKPNPFILDPTLVRRIYGLK